MSFTAREARAVIRKAVGRVPEGEEIRHLNIMPMMDIMTILLVAFIFQAAVSATALAAQTVKLPRALNEEPLPEEASVLIITPTAIVLDTEEIVTVRAGTVDAAEKEGGARGYKIHKLASSLASLLADTREKFEKEGRAPPKIPELLIIADRTTPFRLLFDVIYSAKGEPGKPLYKRFRLLVQRHEPIVGE
jgi:biopolymer transport protein ExbD